MSSKKPPLLKMQSVLRGFGQRVADLRIFHITLPFLMLFLVLGTLAQKYLGLYQATQEYFFSPLVYIFHVPFPGMPLWVALLGVNVLCHLIFKSPWHAARTGSFITHLGVLFLVVGGLFLSSFSEEGYVDLAPNEAASMVSDYHVRELTLLNRTTGERITIPFADILAESKQALAALPFPIDIVESCTNCQITRRQQTSETLYGMAQHMQLSPKALDIQNEKNMAGLTLRLHQTDQDGIYTVLENVAVHPEFTFKGATYALLLEKQKRPLPFALRLVRFQQELYPGTEQAKSYQSEVVLTDGDMQWTSTISMNEPLRYKGYAIFQSSFATTDQGQRSILAVVYNPVRSLPYIASFIICFGMALNLFLKRKLYRTRPLIIAGMCAWMLLSPHGARADPFWERVNTSAAAEIPVLHQGRIKPFDTFARAEIKTLSGSEQNALTTMLSILLAPDTMTRVPLIKVGHSDARSALGLPKAKGSLYSYHDIKAAFFQHQELMTRLLENPNTPRTPGQAELLSVYQKTAAFRDLSNSLSLFFPIRSVQTSELPAPFNTAFAGLPYVSFLEAVNHRQAIEDALKRIIRAQGTDINTYPHADQALALFSFALTEIQTQGAYATRFRVIPGATPGMYETPWSVLLAGSGSPASKTAFDQWRTLTTAFAHQDAAAWNQTMDDILAAAPARSLAFTLEILYNACHVMELSILFYTLGLLLLCAVYITDKPALSRCALVSVSSGALLHAAGILIRIVVLERPPVGTLYESILFAGLVVVCIGLTASVGKKQQSGLWFASIGGTLLQLLAIANDQQSDNIQMLSAVLNTHFWLTTHVLMITAGYAFCLFTSMMAHGILAAPHTIPGRFPVLKKMALLSLLFTALGTILGGVWADQSWGRFWGWDPKENGALLIVLWLTWILHGDISGSFSKRWVVSGLAFLSVIVALSWFGVNLLGVGLHSYGFTDTVSLGLTAFILFEIIAIALLLRFARRGRHA